MAIDWVEEERRGTRAAHELARLFRRMRARPILIATIAAALTALMVWKLSRKPVSFEATVVLRLAESAVGEGDELLPADELKQYIMDVAFVNPKLVEIMEAHDLYKARRELAPQLAVASMREDIEIDVTNNYFLEYRGSETPPRSVRVALSYRCGDPATALAVANDLKDLIVDSESAHRREVSEAAVAAARRGEAELEKGIEDEQRHLANLLLDDQTGRGDRAKLRVDISNARRSIASLGSRLTDQQRQLRQLDFWMSTEENEVGMTFEVAAVIPPIPPRSQKTKLIVAGAVLFVVLLLVCGMTVAAFDPRIYDADDLRRMGLEVVGHLPGFPGDGVGSLDARRAGRHRLA